MTTERAPSTATDGGHARAEARSLALHRAVAERLRDDPTMLERARARVRLWLAEGTVARPVAEAWSNELAGTVDKVARFLVDEGPRGRDLRQSSPFAGALDPRERWRILRDVKGRGIGR